jgi:hypothetical protein
VRQNEPSHLHRGALAACHLLDGVSDGQRTCVPLAEVGLPLLLRQAERVQAAITVAFPVWEPTPIRASGKCRHTSTQLLCECSVSEISRGPAIIINDIK